MAVSVDQVVLSALGAGCGVGLGVFCGAVLEYPRGWALFVGGLGAFIGFALSLPGVSVWRAAGGTAAAVVATNTPRGWGWGGALYRWVAGDAGPAAGPAGPGCEGCGAREGDLHAAGCGYEACPFCGDLLSGCDCVFEVLGLSAAERRLVEESADDDAEPVRAIFERWARVVREEGRVPYRPDRATAP